MTTDRNRILRGLLAGAVLLSLAGFLCLGRQEEAASAAQFRAIAGDRVRELKRAIARRAVLTDAVARVISRDRGLTLGVQDLLDAASAHDVTVLWVAWDGKRGPRTQWFGASVTDQPAWLNDAIGRAARARGAITVPAAGPDGEELLTFARRVPESGPFLGVVLVSARIGDIVERAIGGMEPAAVDVTLSDDALGGRQLFEHRSVSRTRGPRFTHELPLRFADRFWTARVVSTAAIGSGRWGRAGLLALAAGLAAALLAVALTIAVHRKAEQQFAHAQESIAIGVWEWDIVRGRITASPATFRLFGLQPRATFPDAAEWLGLVHPEDRERMRHSLEATLEHGSVYENEFRVIHPGGKRCWLLTRGTLVRDEAGRPVRLKGINLDITAVKTAESALSENQEGCGPCLPTPRLVS